jgi:ADP-ribose pyrophosphatase YjhB (NUDIX family)
MHQPVPQWRPRPSIRPIALGVIWRGDELLLMAVRSDDGSLKGWRPLGGGIEFGERAGDALQRELLEELGELVEEPRFLATLENIYDHHGVTGHEIVFMFATAFLDAAAYYKSQVGFSDGGVHNDVAWVSYSNLAAGRVALYPAGLLELLAGPMITPARARG